MSSTYGLVYDTRGLATLPTDPAHADSKFGAGAPTYDPPIHLLPLPQFSKLHLSHILTHPPDSVLFPFLHGLEGENEAQNTFFISSTHSGSITPRKSTSANSNTDVGGNSSINGIPHNIHHYLTQKDKGKIKPLPPKYRGLVWVVCEEDLEKPLPAPGSPQPQLTASPVPASPAASPRSYHRSPGRVSGRKPVLTAHQRHYIRELAVLRRKKEGGFGDAAFAPPHIPPEALPYPSSGNAVGGFLSEPHSAMYTSTGEDTSDSDFDYDDDSSYDDDYEDDDMEDDTENSIDTPVSAAPPNAVTIETAAKAGNKGSVRHQPRDDPVRVVDQDALNANGQTDVIAMEMDVDVDANSSPPPIFARESNAPSPSPPSSQDGEGEDQEVDKNEGTHMHPVIQRPGLQHRDITVTPATVASSASIQSVNPLTTPASSSAISENGHVHVEPSASLDTKSEDGPKEVKHAHKKSQSQGSLRSSTYQDPRLEDPTLFLITATFRPCEIIRRVPGTTFKDDEDGEWEFVPLKVPDGISLRNFGIQVPIYATISDIVVYSPHGPSSPNAQRLARRIRQAVARKWNERAERARNMGWTTEDLLGAPAPSDKMEDDPRDGETKQREEVLLKYNVFLLDANDDTMRGYSPYSPSSPSGSLQSSPHISHVGETTSKADANSNLAHIMVRVCGGSSGAPITFSSSPPIHEASHDGAPNSDNDSSRSGSTLANVPIADTSPSSGLVAASHEDSIIDMKMNVLTALEQSGPAVASVGGAHTDGSDGHLVEMKYNDGMEVDKATEGRKPVGDEASMDVDIESVSIPPATAAARAGDTSNFEIGQDKKKGRSLSPNTVDFAQREKEEMRDLTKASEIIGLLAPDWEPTVPYAGPPSSVPSFCIPEILRNALQSNVAAPDVHSDKENVEQQQKARQHRSLAPTTWDSRIGQVFLGNAEDVPLLPEIPDPRVSSAPHPTTSSSSYPATSPQSASDLPSSSPPKTASAPATCAVLPSDDPFLYMPLNDPRRGMGFDICIECHDLAPFPSMAHLRAAEEHLSALDLMWAERCVAAVANPSFKEGLAQAFDEQVKSSSADDEKTTNTHGIDTLTIPIPARPPPNANAVIHLPMPSSPPNTQATLAQLMPLIRFLERWIKPVEGDEKPRIITSVPPPITTVPASASDTMNTEGASTIPSDGGTAKHADDTSSPRRWSSMMSSLSSFTGVTAPPAHLRRNRSFTSPAPTSLAPPVAFQPSPTFHPPNPRTRPLKILLYSADGYTESSVPALSLLMAIKKLLLPEAYLELQVEKKRSFFVYQADLGLLKRVEMKLREEREREAREKEREAMEKELFNGNGKRIAQGSPSPTEDHRQLRNGSPSANPTAGQPRRMAAKSVSFAQPPPIPPPVPPSRTPSGNSVPNSAAPTTTVQPAPSPPMVVLPSAQQSSSTPSLGQGASEATSYSAPTSALPTPTEAPQQSATAVKGRPRAMTSPWLPSLFGADHQSWFNDPRFDGSFPSRVLPFLYLGNLNHAANAYMLHALGITHVVSVGECALVPPPNSGSPGYSHPSHVQASSSPYHRPGQVSHYLPGKGPGQGSLWHEEREGRIKVLDIKGVCDDGIDTLEPQLEPICDWIDQARQEGGQVLVHCRVGVSRSATVTIAYVMKHLGLPLVDAYLVVRSRRLSVLIQPNMRLLYNLCGWEIKLAKERAGEDEDRLKRELARTLSWPYLAKEVHALNEKYLH